MTEFAKRPIEFYGRLVGDGPPSDFDRLCRTAACPFLGRRCLKQRKSDPGRTIGACTVGYQRAPMIICPHRFVERNQIFLDCVRFLTRNLQYFVVPEISMPGGSIDYFLFGTRNDEILDYAGIEIQSLDTTGSGGIWQAREDLLGGQLADSYGYGMNWKMSAKTILVQMHHKATAFETLGKKLVLVVQKRFFDYMARQFQTGQLRQADDRDSIHFHIYDVVMLASALQIVLHERKSTNVSGVAQMLNLGSKGGILDHEVIRRIRAKMEAAVRLDVTRS